MSKMLEIASRTVNFLNSIDIQNKQLVYTIVNHATNSNMEEVLSERQLELLFSSYVVARIRDEQRHYSASQLGCNLGLSKAKVEVLLELAGLVEYNDNGQQVLSMKGTEYGKVVDGKFVWLQSTNRILRKLK
jgi:hypothetical protein